MKIEIARAQRAVVYPSLQGGKSDEAFRRSARPP
jgi:hypothetical protein